MNEPHQPSHRQAIVFFVFVVVAAASIVAWRFWLNRGTLEAKASPPFTFSIRGEKTACAELSCTVETTPGKHTVLFSKTGYKDAGVEVVVPRWGKTLAEAALQFIPVLKNIEDFPPNMRPQLPAFVKPETVYAWADDTLFFLRTAADFSQKLIRWTSARGESTIVMFDRMLKNPLMWAGQSGTRVLINEGNGDNSVFYLIDVEGKTRQRLAITDPALSAVSVIDGFIAFRNNTGGGFLYETATGARREIPSLASPVIEYDSGRVIFAAMRDLDSRKPRIGISIDEALEQAKLEASGEARKAPNHFYVTEWRIKENTFRTLAAIPALGDEKITELAYHIKRDRVFLAKGEKKYEIILSGEN